MEEYAILNLKAKIPIQRLFILSLILGLTGCLSQKKPDEQADCGFGESFNAKTRKCNQVISAPAATLDIITRFEGEAAEGIVLTFRDSTGDPAVGCEVQESSTGIEMVSEKVFTLPEDAGPIVTNAATVAAGLVPADAPATAFALAAQTALADAREAETLAQLEQAYEDIIDNTRGVADRAILNGTPVFVVQGNGIDNDLDEFIDEYDGFDDRCICTGGTCRTVLTAFPKFSGTTGFRYRIDDGKEGFSPFQNVSVVIQEVNDDPIPIPQNMSIAEQDTSTSAFESLPSLISLARDQDDDDDLNAINFSYNIFTLPAVGTLAGCLGSGGSGRACSYLVTDADLSDTLPAVDVGSTGSVVFEGMTITSDFEGSAANDISLTTSEFAGVGDEYLGIDVVPQASGININIKVIPNVTTTAEVVSALNGVGTISADLITAVNTFPGTVDVVATPTNLVGGADAQDTFEYSVNDGKDTGPYPGSVNIRVTEVNDLPVLDTGNITPTNFDEDTATTITIPITDSDSALAPTGCSTTIPAGSEISINIGCNCVGVSCSVNVQGSANYFGTATLDIDVDNDGGTTTTERITFTIDSVNDAPTVPADSTENGTEDTTLNVAALTIDEGGGTLENSQTLTVDVDIDAGDTDVIPQNAANIKIYYNGVDLNFDGTTAVSIGDGTNSADALNLSFDFIPEDETSSTLADPVDVTVTVTDSAGDNTTFNLDLVFAEVDDPPTISTINNLETNEGGVAVATGITIDEGGLANEDTDDMSIRVTSDNTLLLPDSAISVYYDTDGDGAPDGPFDLDNDGNTTDPGEEGEFLGAGGSFLAVNDGAADASANNIIIVVNPVDGLNGTANITVDIDDDGVVTAETSTTFALIVHPIGAVHGGWSKISAISQKAFDKEQTNPNKVCPSHTDQCDTGTSCTGTTPPNSSVSADNQNAIYYDSANDRCFYASAAGSSNWEPLNTFCQITDADDVDSGCTGASCIGSGTPSGTVDPASDDQFFYDVTNHVCYRSTGTTNTDWETYHPVTVALGWGDFTISGSGADSSASLAGYNVFRRRFNEPYDFSNPLNGGTVISASTTEYSDNSATVNQVYFYTVQPVDSKRSISTATQEIFNEIRVLTPPKNMVFVHRWIVNQEVCAGMGIDSSGTPPNIPDPTNNYRCPYSGPGEIEDTGEAAYYYDIGYDILMDIAEASCPYSRNLTSSNNISDCGGTECIGLGGKSGALASGAGSELVYYDRSDGTCYFESGGNWTSFGATTPSAAIADATQKLLLPPVVNLGQDDAFNSCRARNDIANANVAGVVNDLKFDLPTRKEYVAVAAKSDDVTDSEQETLERGFSLGSTSKCNSSSASGVDSAFTNATIPSSSFSFSLPGTDASGIRSVVTGSIEVGSFKSTESCVSRYGLQDIYGNVSEWMVERFNCTSANQCFGANSDDANRLTTSAPAGTITSLTAGIHDNFKIASDSIFDSYDFDGVRGPCLDTDSDGDCDANDSPLTSWRYENKSDVDAAYFSFPMGLPIDTNYVFDNPAALSPTSGNLLEIGPSNGITTSELHNDASIVNAEAIENEASSLGAMASGGGYTDGDEAGRFTYELIPITDVAAVAATGGDLSGDTTGNLAFTADTAGAAGNNISVRLISGGTAGAETVSVSSNLVTVTIDSAVSTGTQIETAINADPVASLLVNVTTTNGADTFSTQDGAQLTGGLDAVASTRDDLGYRCLIRVDAQDYSNDAAHPYGNNYQNNY